jgi:hypothetical protein
MTPLKSTTTRLRRTFAYPTDDSSTTNTPEALDEEEQEVLIATLSAQNAARNAQFRSLLLALPSLSCIPYLVSLVRHPQSALLALTSLASTAWLLYRLPPEETGISYLDSLGSTTGGRGGGGGSGILSDDSDSDDFRVGSRRRNITRHRSRTSSFSVSTRAGVHRTPLEKWLPHLNLGLCGVLFVLGILKGARKGSGTLIADLLPGVVYAVVLAAKMVMAGVDPERELGGLRYEYKGA